MNLPATFPKLTGSAGWQAELSLRHAPRRGRTVLVSREQHGPLLVQHPFYPEAGGVCHTYLLHPPAGIVGGDDLTLNLALEPGAHALITTPGATRWYYSRGLHAQSQLYAHVDENASLEWLPRESLLFDGAHARLATRIELCGNARLLGWEILGLGRPACGEIFEHGQLDFRFDIMRDGKPLLLERLRGAGPIAGLREHTALASLVATPADASALEAARAVCSDAHEALCAATLIGDLLVCRGIAAQCAPLINFCTRLWSELRPGLLGRAASPPRIWRT